MAEKENGLSHTTPRRYWLTGAGNGIGAAMAEELLKSGAHLAVSARTIAPLKVLAQRYPGQVLVVAGNLTNSQTVREICERIHQEWGSLDTVILNAGTCEYVDSRRFDNSLIEHVVRTNLLACSYCIEAALPLLRAGVQPHLVGIASSVTDLALPRAEAYGASKPGLRCLFESQRIDLAPEGIEVTLVSPSFIGAPLTGNSDHPMPQMWSADKAAHYVVETLRQRPQEVPLLALSMAALWPLSTMSSRGKLVIGKRMVRRSPPSIDTP
jgi:NAD(P)-dependent dehydrogenase (short-subunit alcohol dehydrogenase family)